MQAALPVTVVLAAADPWVRWDWVGRPRRRDLGRHAPARRAHRSSRSASGCDRAARWRCCRTACAGCYGPDPRVTGILYTIPSLALFALPRPVDGPDPHDRRDRPGRLHAADPGAEHRRRPRRRARRRAGGGAGHGLHAGRQLLRVELPLALPAIIAGIRIATVTTIGLVTVTALIGQGGLGQLILDGLIPRLPHPAGRRLRAVGRAGRCGRCAPARRRAAAHTVGRCGA